MSGGGAVSRWCRSWIGSPVLANGSRPVSAQYIVAPSPNRSARASTVCGSRACSGATDPTVPGIVPGTVTRRCGCRASPKSSDFACQSGVTTMFDGFAARHLGVHRVALKTRAGRTARANV